MKKDLFYSGKKLELSNKLYYVVNDNEIVKVLKNEIEAFAKKEELNANRSDFGLVHKVVSVEATGEFRKGSNDVSTIVLNGNTPVIAVVNDIQEFKNKCKIHIIDNEYRKYDTRYENLVIGGI